MKEWLLGVLAAAFLVSILNAMGGNWPGQEIRRLVSGLLLTLAVFRPMGNLDLTIPELEVFRAEGEAAAEAGLEQADKMRHQHITQSYCAYILTKADGLGLQAEAEVAVGENGFPQTVTIRACASPGERQELTGMIVRELGIEKEAVVWIDPYQSSESMPFCEHTNIPS